MLPKTWTKEAMQMEKKLGDDVKVFTPKVQRRLSFQFGFFCDPHAKDSGQTFHCASWALLFCWVFFFSLSLFFGFERSSKHFGQD